MSLYTKEEKKNPFGTLLPMRISSLTSVSRLLFVAMMLLSLS